MTDVTHGLKLVHVAGGLEICLETLQDIPRSPSSSLEGSWRTYNAERAVGSLLGPCSNRIIGPLGIPPRICLLSDQLCWRMWGAQNQGTHPMPSFWGVAPSLQGRVPEALDRWSLADSTWELGLIWFDWTSLASRVSPVSLPPLLASKGFLLEDPLHGAQADVMEPHMTHRHTDHERLLSNLQFDMFDEL